MKTTTSNGTQLIKGKLYKIEGYYDNMLYIGFVKNYKTNTMLHEFETLDNVRHRFDMRALENIYLDI